MQLKLAKEKILHIFSYLWLFGSFGLIDAWLRVVTRWIGRYSIYAIAPNLFTVLWAVVLTALVTFPKSRKTGRIVYGIAYFLFLIFAAVQYGSYLVLGNFLWLSDFLNAGEGADYASWVVGVITPALIFQILALVAVGMVGIWIFPQNGTHRRPAKLTARVAIVAAALLAMQAVPLLYTAHAGNAGTFDDPRLEYERFSNANYDLELTGMYQYLVKDFSNQLSLQISRRWFVDTETIGQLDAYFAEKAPHSNNDWTGIFAGKNLIVIQLETIDDWMITAEDLPTLYRMMHEGINFSNFYTPSYANGYTFNTEFAFHTAVYPYSNGNATSSLIHSTFSHSIASRFAEAGYSAHSFHVGAETFYNRGNIHKTLGYTKYHSYLGYPAIDIPTANDCYLTQNDRLYQDVVSGDPFFSFVISYSAHLPFTDDDALTRHALNRYPQYDTPENRELNILKAKARLTDDMLAQLLRRLEADGLLEETVIVAYGDHYAYGLSDQKQLQQLSEAAGSSILERTPAFIYCADLPAPVSVDKVTQITDFAPTLMNLFGLDVPTAIMGRDIFDPGYSGYAIFPDQTWLTAEAYIKNGVTVWNTGMTKEEIAQMNAYVQQAYWINDAILDTDYYRYRP